MSREEKSKKLKLINHEERLRCSRSRLCGNDKKLQDSVVMGRLARKKQHKGDKPLKEKYRLKRKTKDLDQIQADMLPGKADELLRQDVDLDKPGAAQHYCLHCAKYFISSSALKDHFRGKPHKRRLKALETEAYTQEEAERAAGMGSYKQPKHHGKVSTQPVQVDMDTAR